MEKDKQNTENQSEINKKSEIKNRNLDFKQQNSSFGHLSTKPATGRVYNYNNVQCREIF